MPSSALTDALSRLERKIGEVDAAMPLTWFRPAKEPKNPVTARPTRRLEKWCPQDLSTLRKNAKNWFYASLVFPAEKEGVNLRDEKAFFFVYGYTPFTLWIDGEEIFRETHAWQASGPMADPVIRTIVPGRTYRLVLCIEPTELPYDFNPLSLVVKALPCLEKAVDLMAAATQLRFADALAQSPREHRQVAAAAATLDLAALTENRWPTVFASIGRMEQALQPLSRRAKEMTVHLIGHTHIDMDWQWTWSDTVHCIRRDFKSTTDLLTDQPHLRFSLSQMPLYRTIKETDPAIFAKVRKMIRDGRWENVASTWVEGDLNMADGEAVARHLLYAADWGQKELGTRSTVMWEPDTFGHPANMPQLARLGGCDVYFHWRCNPGRENNWPVRLWKGADGSSVLGISSAYGGALLPGVWMYGILYNALHAARFGLKNAHHVWGSGDHGGGLARHQLTLFERFRHKPLMPRFTFSTVREFADAVLQEKDKLPTNEGETYLLFEGCFTTHARMKMYNRKCEGALLVAETLAALAGMDRVKALRDAWTPILYNQFHDIFDGAAVHDSYEDAYRRAETSLRTAADITAESVARLAAPAKDAGTVLVINPLGFERDDLARLPLPKNTVAVTDQAGTTIPVQHSDGNAVFRATRLPAFAGNVFKIVHASKATARPAAVTVTEDAAWFTIETAHAVCRLSKTSGAIGSCFSKSLRRELIGYGVPKHLSHVPVTRLDLALNVFQVIDEAPNPMTAWLINDILKEENLLRGAKVELLETGPLFARFRVTHAFRSSRIEEDICFFQDHPRIEFKAVIDWRERGSPETGIPQLKVSFATAMTAGRVRGEGPFTIHSRPADGQEQVTQKWADLEGEEFGFTLFNDSRYGFDALGGRLRLTLLRNAYNPDPDSDHGRHEVRFAFEPHAPGKAAADLVRAGMAYNRPAIALTAKALSPRLAQPQLCIANAPGIVCTALRRAEHSRGTLVRLFEAEGRACRAEIGFGADVRSAKLVNFLEDLLPEKVAVRKGRILVPFRPYEVKTLLLG